jgi:hypothetical protein
LISKHWILNIFSLCIDWFKIDLTLT